MLEEWLPINGYEGLYEVSNLGRIKSLERKRINSIYKKGNMNISEKILKPQIAGEYYIVRLSKNGKVQNKRIHQLVALHFINNPKMNIQINHKDCNKLNNRVDNLEWCSPRENIRHSMKNGLQKETELKKALKKIRIFSRWNRGKYTKLKQELEQKHNISKEN